MGVRIVMLRLVAWVMAKAMVASSEGVTDMRAVLSKRAMVVT